MALVDHWDIGLEFRLCNYTHAFQLWIISQKWQVAVEEATRSIDICKHAFFSN